MRGPSLIVTLAVIVPMVACSPGRETGSATAKCVQGGACAPAQGSDPCRTYATVCSTQDAASRCEPAGAQRDGTRCGDGSVCRAGACVAACVPRVPCAPAVKDECNTYATACNSAATETTCVPMAKPEGTNCGLGSLCSRGSCVACSPGASCPAGWLGAKQVTATGETFQIGPVTLMIPQGAVTTATEIAVTLSDVPPGAPPAEWSTWGPTVVLEKSPPGPFASPIAVEIDAPEAPVASVFFWDGGAGAYHPVLAMMPASTAGRAVFATDHFTPFVWLQNRTFAETYPPPGVPSFHPIRDGFQQGNVGTNFCASSEGSGSCLGIASFAGWYFTGPGQVEPLYGAFARRTVEEATSAYEIMGRAQCAVQRAEAAAFGWIALIAAGATARFPALIPGAVRACMSWNRAPVILLLQGASGGHAVLAYRYDRESVWIYDSNYPGDDMISMAFSDIAAGAPYVRDARMTFAMVGCSLDGSVTSRFSTILSDVRSRVQGQGPWYTPVAADPAGTGVVAVDAAQPCFDLKMTAPPPDRVPVDIADSIRAPEFFTWTLDGSWGPQPAPRPRGSWGGFDTILAGPDFSRVCLLGATLSPGTTSTLRLYASGKSPLDALGRVDPFLTFAGYSELSLCSKADCTNRCGSDGCGGLCPDGCVAPAFCQPDGTCKTACEAVRCVPPATCQPDGTCKKACEVVPCVPPAVCQPDGTCRPPCTSNADCASGTTCQAGGCAPPPSVCGSAECGMAFNRSCGTCAEPLEVCPSRGPSTCCCYTCQDPGPTPLSPPGYPYCVPFGTQTCAWGQPMLRCPASAF